MKTKLNPDKTIVKMIKEGLKETGGQCPCVPRRLWNEDTKCPCKKFREEKECMCGLYVREDTNEIQKTRD